MVQALEGRKKKASSTTRMSGAVPRSDRAQSRTHAGPILRVLVDGVGGNGGTDSRKIDAADESGHGPGRSGRSRNTITREIFAFFVDNTMDSVSN
jgi:hypothetical protein